MNFFIHKSKDGQYFFNIMSSNGNVLAHSEDYVQKESAKHAAQLIIDEAKDATIFDMD